MPYTNTQRMNVFMQKLAEVYPQDDILLVVDNSGWHRSVGLIVPSTVILYPLLPYTPELSPIEMIGNWIREKVFRNEIISSLADVLERLCPTVSLLVDDPSRVASITHRNSIFEALLN